ncbi:MAG: GyrI-like domain-containing protein [candidate division WOR-3 bacterium]|nr:GyrI-like domain-containing protein [candidate division WOR-3 bacterium]MDH5682864.1 GyrI-like domain-containing protein [candidate division WOR-3 bacterium]
MDKIYNCVVIVLITLMMVGCGEQKTQPVQKPTTPEQPQFTAAVKTIDSMYVASMSKIGPYAEMGKPMMELFTWLGKNKVKPTGAPFGVYYDDPMKVKPESTKYEICVPVPAKTKGDKMVKVKKFGPAQVAATLYIGPYDKVGPTYQKLAEWVMNNNYEIVGPAHEFYLNSPDQVPAESLKTEIAFPVKSKAPTQPTEGKK